MAQRAVTSLLRYVLSDSIAESDLQAQVFGGSVGLTDAQLRTFDLPCGLCCTGVLGQASAEWSWTGLLSSPVVVKASQVYIIVKPGSSSGSTEAPAGGPEPAYARASSKNFFGRMKNRIWDQLSLEVDELHVRLEVPAGPTCGAGGAAGFTLGNLVVSVDHDGASSALAQNVQLKDLGVYVQPHFEAGTAVQIPDDDAFVLRGLSPLCQAERHSGRRFADWRGLEVRLDLAAPKFAWTQDQYRCLLRLASYMSSSGGSSAEETSLRAADQGADPHDAQDDEWHDAQQDLEPVKVEAEPVAVARRSWWPSWLSASKSSSATPTAPTAPEELPEGVSSADRELLLREEPAPPETAQFVLSVQLEAAALNALTSHLQLHFGGSLRFVYSMDCWQLGCHLSALRVVDAAAPAGVPAILDFTHPLAGAGAQTLSTADAEKQAQTSASVISLEVDYPAQEVSIAFAPANARLTPTVITAIRNFSSMASSTSEEDSSPESKLQQAMFTCCQEFMEDFLDVSETASEAESAPQSVDIVGLKPRARPWSLTSKLPSITASVGEPWLPGARLMLQFRMDGHANTAGACGAKVHASVDLEDEQSRRPCIDECTLSVCYTDRKTMIRISPLVGRCCLHELSALTRAAREHLFSHVPEGSVAQHAKCTAMMFDISMPSINFCVVDELGVELSVSVESPSLYFDGKVFAAHASPCSIKVKVDGEDRGSVSLLGPQGSREGVKISYSPDAPFQYEVSASVSVYDAAVNHVAISCPSVVVQASYRAGLSVSPALGHEALNGFQLKVSIAAPVELDSTEDFVTSLVQGLSYLSDVSASFFVKTVTFDSRPFGLNIKDAQVLGVSGLAEALGVKPGSTLCGVTGNLARCPLPVTLLFEEPPATIMADVAIDAFNLKAKRFSAKRCVDITVDDVEVAFAGLKLTSWRGSWSDLADEVSQFYNKSIVRQVPWLATAISIGGRTVCALASRSIGSSLALLKFGGGVASAVGGTIAMGVYDAVSTSARHGSQLRDDDKYQFGDVTRGMLHLARNRGRQEIGTYDDSGPGPTSAASGLRETVVGSTKLVSGYVKSTQAVSTTAGAAAGGMAGAAVGGTAGAAVGGTLGALAGPVGVIAGSAAGGIAAGHVSKAVQSTVDKGKESRGSNSSDGYRFGDLTRGITAAGMEVTRGITAAGREARQSSGDTQGGYKFGDFSRGLFSKATGSSGRR